MNIPNFVTFCALFLILQCERITSSTVNNRKDEGYCESYSSKLKDENEKLVKRLLDIADNKDQVKANNQRMEELQKTNEDLRKTIDILGESVLTQKANTDKLNDFISNMVEDLKLKASTSIEDNFKKEIEQLKNQLLTNMKRIEDSEKQLKIERNLRESLEKEMANNNNWIRETELRAKNELKDRNVKKEKLENQIEQLDAQIESYKKQLKESQKLNQSEKRMADCKELTGKYVKPSCKGLQPGTYDINILGYGPISVLCYHDMIIIQERYEDKEVFYRNWTEYRNGFGLLYEDHFLGLELLHQITKSKPYELHITLKYGDEKVYAIYDNFRIGNEDSGYALESLGKFNGTVPDEMRRNLNQKFSTYDRDNDRVADKNCALESNGAWWFGDCDGPNLNGKFNGDSNSKKMEIMSWDRVSYPQSVTMSLRSKSPE